MGWLYATTLMSLIWIAIIFGSIASRIVGSLLICLLVILAAPQTPWGGSFLGLDLQLLTLAISVSVSTIFLLGMARCWGSKISRSSTSARGGSPFQFGLKHLMWVTCFVAAILVPATQLRRFWDGYSAIVEFGAIGFFYGVVTAVVAWATLRNRVFVRLAMTFVLTPVVGGLLAYSIRGDEGVIGFFVEGTFIGGISLFIGHSVVHFLIVAISLLIIRGCGYRFVGSCCCCRSVEGRKLKELKGALPLH